jgi:hypothetical protein
VAKSDFDDLESGGLNPLDGDLFDSVGPAEPAGLEAAGPLEGMNQLEAASQLEASQDALGLPPAPVLHGMADEQVQEQEAPREKGPGLVARLSESNPYTVMLVVSAVALAIAILCLLLEWGSFGFDTKAKSASGSAAVSAPANPTAGALASVDVRIC